MDFKKILKNFKLLFGLKAALSLLGIFVILFLNSYVKESITETIDKMKRVNQEIQGKANILENHFLLKKESEKAAPLEVELEKKLASKDDLLKLQEDFASIAKDTGVEVSSSFTGETEEKNGLLGKAGVSASIDGSFTNIIRFLKRVEKSRFLVQFDNFDVNTILGEKDKLRLFARGKIIYRLE
ncbi:MAG: type 4a pilus biogenesis protein PilO [Candidatus Pacebacteria bacterium]|nr:type 4a pilus biogenesis protein PilO [Candidatus Paceibacterota bacterium]